MRLFSCALALVITLALATPTWGRSLKGDGPCLKDPFTVTCYTYTTVLGLDSHAECVIETGRNTLIGEGDRRLGKVVVQDSDGVSAFYDGFVYGFPSELPAYVVIHANVDLGDGYMDYRAQHHDFNQGKAHCVKYPHSTYPEGPNRPAIGQAVACTFDNEC